jgi:hypothetical protein
MRGRILHRVAVQNQTVAADTIVTHDLAVNPLSAVLVCLRPLNETSTLTNFQRQLGICGALNRVSVLHRGASVFSMSGRDAFALNYFRHGFIPSEANPDDADNERRCVVLPLLMGRFAYDPESCLPSTVRGELILEMDIDVADTGYDGFQYTVETIELLGVRPREFERKTSQSVTFTATGDNDVFLRVGHVLRGLLLFGTTTFTGAAPAPSWGRVCILGDGSTFCYASTDFEVGLSLHSLMGRQPASIEHTHRVNAASASTTEETTGPIEYGAAGLDNYCWLDLDPTRDDTFSVDTRDFTDLVVRADAETADAVRVIQVEAVGL